MRRSRSVSSAGRRDGSVELDPVPPGSHVERVVMEDDSGNEREIYRRSFPYGDTTVHGLYFLGFAADLSTFVDMLHRMYGVTDGVRDRLTDISTAVSGAFYLALSEPALDSVVEAEPVTRRAGALLPGTIGGYAVPR